MNNINLIWDKLLEAVLLLFGLVVIQIAFVWVVSLVGFDYFPPQQAQFLYSLLPYSAWFFQFAFGLIIYFKLRPAPVAASVGFLSTMIPLFGVVFYLIISTQIQSDDERQML